MGVAIDVHIVATVVFLASQGHPEAAVLGNPAGLDGLVDEAGHDIVDSFG